jgi:hypothetical protein
MSDDKEPQVKCTEFISELYSDESGKIYINTEFETPEALKYIGYLIRLGNDQGFNIPSAGRKSEMLAAILISYKRQGRLENVVALVGNNQQQQAIMPLGSLPYTATTTPNGLPSAAQPVKKHWWSRAK